MSEDGRLYPSVQSWNLSCITDHAHHAYWRMDFDIGGSDQDQVFSLNRNSSKDDGWGPGWQKYLTEEEEEEEEEDKKPQNHSQDRVGFVRDYPTGRVSGLFMAPLMANRASFQIATSRFAKITVNYRDEDAG